MYDQPGSHEALRSAHNSIAAASDYEVFVVCAQDRLRIGIEVDIHNAPIAVDTQRWEGTMIFPILFPSARLHVGDVTGNAIVADLPHIGHYAVVLQHAGRERAVETRRRVRMEGSEPPWPMNAEDPLRVWDAVERYRIGVYPLPDA